MTRSCIFLVTLVVVAWIFTATADTVTAQAGAATAQDAASTDDSLVSEQTLFDFRRLLMVGFSMVFLLLIGYLMLSHRKNAALAEDLAFLRKRIESLESPLTPVG